MKQTVICPCCKHKVEVEPDKQTKLVYQYCSYCGDILSGEELENGEVEIDD